MLSTWKQFFLTGAKSPHSKRLFHEVCHFSKIYLLIDGLKLENGILKEVGSNEWFYSKVTVSSCATTSVII